MTRPAESPSARLQYALLTAHYATQVVWPDHYRQYNLPPDEADIADCEQPAHAPNRAYQPRGAVVVPVSFPFLCHAFLLLQHNLLWIRWFSRQHPSYDLTIAKRSFHSNSLRDLILQIQPYLLLFSSEATAPRQLLPRLPRQHRFPPGRWW